MNTLVVYDPENSHVKSAALRIAQNRNAELLELRPVSGSNGFVGYTENIYNALSRKCVNLAPLGTDVINYDNIVLCTTLCLGNVLPTSRTFLTLYGMRCKAMEYVLIYKKSKDFTRIFNEMDMISHKKRVNASSFLPDDPAIG